MNIYLVKSRSALVILISLISWSALAQEYDDMYFTKKDRKKVEYELEVNDNDSYEAYQSSQGDSGYEEEYLDKKVNPDYIAKYRAQSMGESVEDNPTYGMADDEAVEYFPEETARPSYSNVNTTYSSPYSPSSQARNPFAFYNPMFGVSTAMSVTYMFGSPGYYGITANDPFWNMGGYDPYWSYRYTPNWVYAPRPAAYNPYYGGYDPFGSPVRYVGGSGYNYYCPPAYGYGNPTIVSTSISTAYVEVQRTKVKAPRQSGRSTTVTGRSGVETRNTSSSRYISGSSATSSRAAARSTKARDFTATQNEYFNRSVSSSTRSAAASAFSRKSSESIRSSRSLASTARSSSSFSGASSSLVKNRNDVGSRSSSNFSSSSSSSRRYNTSSMPSRNNSYTPSSSSFNSRSSGSSFRSNSSGGSRSSSSFSSGSRSSTPRSSGGSSRSGGSSSRSSSSSRSRNN